MESEWRRKVQNIHVRKKASRSLAPEERKGVGVEAGCTGGGSRVGAMQPDAPTESGCTFLVGPPSGEAGEVSAG